jgi:four helix bundle protein
MDAQELRDRSHRFALDIIAFCKTLPTDSRTREIGDQLHDAAHSIAMNYRAACRARSRAEFIAKICITVEEADEAQGWLETLNDSGIATSPEARRLLQESTELLKILAASNRTAMRNQANRGKDKKGGRSQSKQG